MSKEINVEGYRLAHANFCARLRNYKMSNRKEKICLILN